MKIYFTTTAKSRSLKVLIVFMCLILCVSQESCKQSAVERKGEVSIPDIRNITGPEENLATHKPYDIEVHRILFMGNGYRVRYYQTENDTLKSHSASYMTDDDFDKAAYSWLTDTSVSIRLYNTALKKEKVLKVWGFGPRSSMSME